MHETYKVFRGNGLLMDLESLKAAVFTDRTNQGFCFHKVVGIINCDDLALARPGSFSELLDVKTASSTQKSLMSCCRVDLIA